MNVETNEAISPHIWSHSIKTFQDWWQASEKEWWRHEELLNIKLHCDMHGTDESIYLILDRCVLFSLSFVIRRFLCLIFLWVYFNENVCHFLIQVFPSV
jgi:hypothetical protein